MHDSELIIYVGVVVVVTVLGICLGLGAKKDEVDALLKEHNSNYSNHGSEKPFIPENDTDTPSAENHPEKPEMVESVSVDPEVSIDWDLLQNYSDDLGYWIDHLQFEARSVYVPFLLAAYCHIFITTYYPGQYTNLKYYTYFGTLPVNLRLQSILYQHTPYKKYSSKYTNLVVDTDKTNPLLASLEVKLISSMKKYSEKV